MTATGKVLIVDDDIQLRDCLAEQLRTIDGIDVVEAGSGGEALSVLENAIFSAILLDIGLPDMDGRDLCSLIGRRGVRAPIILLTAFDSEADQMLGFNVGAVDYVVKPVRYNVLSSRLRAHLRMHERTSHAVFDLQHYQFRPMMRQLIDTRTKRRIPLTVKETEILKYLVRAGERSVSWSELLHEVFGYSARAETHTLQTHIYRMRRKICIDPHSVDLIKTEIDGYSLRRGSVALAA